MWLLQRQFHVVVLAFVSDGIKHLLLICDVAKGLKCMQLFLCFKENSITGSVSCISLKMLSKTRLS